jgi:glucose/arabinose dehydrogenase
MLKRSFAALTVALVLTAGLLAQKPGAMPACDPDNGGLKLPAGFCALVVADAQGPARDLTVAPNGDIYLMSGNQRNGPKGGVTAMRDTNGDGKADEIKKMETLVGTGIELRGGYLYISSDVSIGRFKLNKGDLLPTAPIEMMVEGFIEQRAHASKPFTFDDKGNMYVTVGAPSNACQNPDRKEGVPGQDPCPLLERQGGVWRFNADKPGQTQTADGHKFATGIRNAVALTWNPLDKQVYAVQHGRDSLDTLWPAKGFTAKDNAERPAEELFQLTDGSNFGWPKCFYDLKANKKILNPEYGGDGVNVGGCDQYGKTLVAFPAHTAPNDILFYAGSQFPAAYKAGAFVAFHGSWNRAPEPQEGYYVMFAPWSGSGFTGKYETFAEGFAGEVKAPGKSTHRPTGLALGPDGSLYISDSEKWTIWRILYKK